MLHVLQLDISQTRAQTHMKPYKGSEEASSCTTSTSAAHMKDLTPEVKSEQF